jgi:hypothetical protein
MKYLKRMFETSATGGNNGSILGGEVYNMPVSGNSTLTPSAISYNTGSVNMNNTSTTETIIDGEEEVEEEEEDDRPKVKKDKLTKKFIEIEEKDSNVSEEPKVMNWQDYLKSETTKIKQE